MIGRNSFNRISSLIRKWEGALWLAGAVGVVLIGGILSGWFWDKLGGDTESFSTTLRNVALVIGGVAAILLAVWRSRVSERQATIAQYQAETAQQSLMNERYQRGAEMLGSEVLSVRLGGIYALQRLAVEHPNQYHIQIMRLFCAFVRLPTKDQSLEVGQAAIEPGTLVGIRQDVEAIMEAIGSRAQSRIDIERKEDFRLDLRGANSRVPGSGVRGRGSGERETTASSLAGKEESSRKEDNSGQGKDGPAGAIAQGGNGR